MPGHPDWETGPHQKEEEFARAVALALFDYLRKSHSQGFVVSLSGGADSSAVAVLIHLMVQFGGRELGFDNLAEKLPHIKSTGRALKSSDAASQSFVGKLLTCVYQSTRNSGKQTFEAAQTVADAVSGRIPRIGMSTRWSTTT